MERNSRMWATRIIAGMILLLVLIGCGEQATAPSSASKIRLWIEDSPDKPMNQIQIEVPESTIITLTIQDHEGRHVKLLLDGWLDAGAHAMVWNGRNDQDESVASGPYWAVISIGGDIQGTAMIMIK